MSDQFVIKKSRNFSVIRLKNIGNSKMSTTPLPSHKRKDAYTTERRVASRDEEEEIKKTG